MIPQPWTRDDAEHAAKAIGEELVDGMLSYPGITFREPNERFYCNPERFPAQLIYLAAYMEAKCNEAGAFLSDCYMYGQTAERRQICVFAEYRHPNSAGILYIVPQPFQSGDPISKAIATIRVACDVLKEATEVAHD